MSPTLQPRPGPRLLGVDFGEARIGVAGSDELGMLAHPLETVPAQPREEALKRIAALAVQRRVGGLVMGLPIRSDGEEGAAAVKVRAFSEALKKHLPPDLTIYFQDEYRSTVQATEQLRAAGKRTKQHRPVIDQAAAVVILQDFLDSHPTPLPEAGLGGTD